MKQKRAAGYVRVSQVGGREGDSFLSPDVQREKIEAWAAFRGYRIVRWFVDLDRPASKGAPPRPEFDRMMGEARAGAFEAIAVYRLTRFARSVSQAAATYDELERLGVALVSVTEDIDTTTVAGNLMRNILFALAEFESQRIGEEWRNVHASRRKRGIAHVVTPMYGYRVKVKGAEIIGVQDAEAPGVQVAFKLRAQGATMREIRERLERDGFRPKRGGSRFALSSIRDMLRNPIYAGLVRLPDDTLIDATHDAIVPRDVWEAVQGAEPRTRALTRFSSRRLLSGLLVCESCGFRMVFQQASGKRPPSYKCGSGDRSEPCPYQMTISAAPTEDYVERLFLSRFDPALMPNAGKVQGGRERAGWARRVTRLRVRVEETNRELDTLADELVRGTIPSDEYRRQFERLAEARAAATDEADVLEQRLRASAPPDRDVLDLWPELDVTTKRRALNLVMDRIVVRPGKRGSRRIDFDQRLAIDWTR